MGGYGSTRWSWERTRQDTAGLLRLDVHCLKRAGALQPGTVSTSSWARADGELAGDIVTRMDRDGDRLTLEYRTRAAGEADWTRRTIHVWLERTPCNYGGERVWFRCPQPVPPCGALQCRRIAGATPRRGQARPAGIGACATGGAACTPYGGYASPRLKHGWYSKCFPFPIMRAEVKAHERLRRIIEREMARLAAERLAHES